MNILKEDRNLISMGSSYEYYFLLSETEKILNCIKDSGKLSRKSIYYKIIENLFDISGKTDSSIPWIATLSGNMGIRRNNLTERFDENFINWGFEHFEFGYRLYKLGYEFTLNREAKSYHIAHPRNKEFYQDNINQSHSYFYSKHKNIEISLLLDFINGKISLQEYEIEIGEKKVG